MPETITILYVDDERALLDLGNVFLEETGRFRVDTSISARSALSILQIKEYDAILSDYQMPGMDGIDFLKTVRASGNTIPFILFTGKGREEIVIQALNEGADFYLQKGGDPESLFAELMHKIRQAVQQRRAEASIRDHERREADIINFLPDATFAIDTSGVVIAWNRAMEVFSGTPAAEILGRGNYEYALSIYHKRRPVLIDLILKDDPAIEREYPHIQRSDGKIFSEIFLPEKNNGAGAMFWFTASPIYDANGCMVGAIESIRDITGQKRAENAARESAERYRSLITLSNTGAWEYDRDTGNYWCSPECFTMIGRDASQYLPAGGAGLFAIWMSMLHPDDRKIAADHLARYIQDGSPGIYENHFRIQHADGHWVWIWSRGWTLRKDDGTPTGKTIGTFIDITERREADERQRTYTEHLRLAQEIGKTGSWEFDVLTGMIWGSEETFRICGLKRPEDGLVTPETIDARIAERGVVQKALMDLINAQIPFDVIYTINPDDGSGPRTVHSVARVIPTTEGRPAKIVGVIQDVSGQRKMA